MYHHHGVSTLEILIRDLQAKINNPSYDSLYLKRLENFLENKIKKEYGNILVVATILLIENNNKKRNNKISEKNQLYPRNKEFANHFEKMLRSKTKSKIYPLISIEDRNGHPVLIVGEPDGLSFEGDMHNKAKIHEVKSFDLTAFINHVKESRKDILNRNFRLIEITSSQLMLYQHLLERTQEFGLIGKIDKINLYGTIYFYSENLEYVNWARETIEQNFKIIKRGAIIYNAHNLSLKNIETINMNNKKIHYFEIDFRIYYSEKVVKYYLKNLDEIIKSSNYVDNRNL